MDEKTWRTFVEWGSGWTLDAERDYEQPGQPLIYHLRMYGICYPKGYELVGRNARKLLRRAMRDGQRAMTIITRVQNDTTYCGTLGQALVMDPYSTGNEPLPNGCMHCGAPTTNACYCDECDAADVDGVSICERAGCHKPAVDWVGHGATALCLGHALDVERTAAWARHNWARALGLEMLAARYDALWQEITRLQEQIG